MQRIAIIVLGLSTLATGCEDLRQFKTGPDQIFGGEVVGSDADSSGDSFIRKGFASHTQLELRFNPNASGVPETTDAGIVPRRRPLPGMIHTYLCPDGTGDCTEDERIVGPFDQARLLAIDSLAHDTLSQYTFPGGGRLHNYIFSLRFASPTAAGSVARDAMVFVSLMETGKIEVRVIAPSVLDDDGETERASALFGVFSLKRQRL